MRKVTDDILLLSSDGKEEIGTIPAHLMEWYMMGKNIKSRSKKSIENAALALIKEIVSDAKKIVKNAKKQKRNKK